MRIALILAVAGLAAACGDSTTDPPTATTAQPPAQGDGGFVTIDDPNAPCEQECPEGSWCSYGRCVMP